MPERLSQYYKALANPVRLRVFMHVVNHSVGSAPKLKQESCVSEISRNVGIPQPTTSNHLRVLEEAGLVKSIKVGTKCYQYVSKDAAKELLENAEYLLQMSNKNPY